MKRYIGTRAPMTVQDWRDLGHDEETARALAGDRIREARVVVLHDSGVEPLRHHVLHSPTGFEWGYGGSGPADLARCILIDHFNLHRQIEASKNELPLPVSTQDFKFDVIAELPRDGFMLTSDEIEDWVRAHRKAPA